MLAARFIRELPECLVAAFLLRMADHRLSIGADGIDGDIFLFAPAPSFRQGKTAGAISSPSVIRMRNAAAIFFGQPL